MKRELKIVLIINSLLIIPCFFKNEWAIFTILLLFFGNLFFGFHTYFGKNDKIGLIYIIIAFVIPLVGFSLCFSIS